MRRLLRAGLTCAYATALIGAAAQAAHADAPLSLRPLGAHRPLANERLSDERRLTRYANAVGRAAIRTWPSATAPAVARLRYQTEDGPLEIYPVLESRVDTAGCTWLRVRVPMRPNGRTGWVRRQALGPLSAVRTRLRVNRATLRATLYRDGRRIWTSRIGVGAAATPTPAGRFWIRTRLRALAGGTIYGPYAFGTGAYSVLSDWPGGGVIGIHGTNQPQLIPGRPSHGCIRVPNHNIRRLAQLMPIGTPVQIL
ncbi:MAG: L,D-transpeptidase [Solirubrobacteraceae bacterium]|nr:L,D-transpeptidase [Solirubrobacteraceae bacterium]